MILEGFNLYLKFGIFLTIAMIFSILFVNYKL